MAALKFGLVSPFGEARFAADLAYEAERTGWDGFFIGEAIWHNDAWVALAAAMRTERIRLGTMLSPMPVMKPWKLAAESASLDNLSNGRVILSLGLGAVWMGWQAFPDYAADIKTRAELLDKGIDILSLLYCGKPFDYDGKHYHLRLTAVDEQHYPPPPLL
jgi:alkanesulfonate monooxygenase SsuD/methylene tetrahydromethanopterin reductase-like flavin-dependent oxidoreductase (luciferase family)